MRRATKRRVRIFLWLVLAGALIGAAYGGVVGRVFRETGLIGGSIGAIDGAAIAVPIGAIEVFGLRTRSGRAVQRAPFLVTFGLKWLVYGVLISIVNLRSLGVLVLGLVAIAAPLPVSVALWSVAFSFAVAFAFVFVFQVSQIVGPRTLGHLVFGRYHQPHLEDRFFLFVDIRGSTTLAERIGPIAVHRFLAAIFGLASDPIADHGSGPQGRPSARLFLRHRGGDRGGGGGVRARVRDSAPVAGRASRRAGHRWRDRGFQARDRLSRRRHEYGGPPRAGDP